MLTASRTGFCIAGLFAFVMLTLFFIQYWVYPAAVGEPFGQDILVGIVLGILAVMATVVYLALRVVMR